MTASSLDAVETPGAAEHLRQIERDRLRSLVNADLDRARALHAPDFQLITPIGAALSKEQYLGAIAAGHIRYLTWEPGDMEVRLYGAAAVIRYRAQLEVVFGGHPVPLADYWHTDIYEQRDGQWRVVWSQATSINQG